MVDMIVPYNRTYDVVAWPGSQGYVRFQTATFWPRHVITFTKTYCDQNTHRPYTGRNNISSWGEIGQWLHSEMPNYFKWRLVDWAGGYMGKGSPFEASKKSRVYDDVCS